MTKEIISGAARHGPFAGRRKVSNAFRHSDLRRKIVEARADDLYKTDRKNRFLP